MLFTQADFDQALQTLDHYTDPIMVKEIHAQGDTVAQHLSHTAFDLKFELRGALENAQHKAIRLQEKMAELSEGLAKKGAIYSFNELGESQGRGAELDVALAKLDAVRKEVTRFHRLAQAIE